MDVEETLPPGTMVTTAGAVVLLACGGLDEQIIPLFAVMDHTVDSAPVRKTTEVTVVDEHVYLQLAAEMVVVGEGLFGIVAVDGIELDAALTTPVDGFVEELTFAHRPQDELVALLNEHPQGLYGKGLFRAYLRITVLDDRSVEIYCDEHRLIDN